MTGPVLAPLSSTIAELTIPRRPSVCGVRTSGFPAVHEVGVHGSPRWRLRQPMSPDDAWEIDTLPGGSLLSGKRSVPEELEWAYMTWAERSRAESGAAVLWALPPGRYLLARSARVPRAEQRVLLGNERVPSPANVRVLLDERPFYALAVGAEPGAPPETTRPLIGLAVLNYVGDWMVTGSLFFELVRGEAPDAPSEGDMVLVVPAEGEMVLDALAGYSDDKSAEAKDDWRKTGARALAEALARSEP